MESKHVKNMKLLAGHVETFPRISAARIGAMIVRGNDRIITGNSNKSHPFLAQFIDNTNKIYLHAETRAIIRAITLFGEECLEECTLYVCRLAFESSTRENLQLALSKPCGGCQTCIGHYNLRRVIYTTGDPFSPFAVLE